MANETKLLMIMMKQQSEYMTQGLSRQFLKDRQETIWELVESYEEDSPPESETVQMYAEAMGE